MEHAASTPSPEQWQSALDTVGRIYDAVHAPDTPEILMMQALARMIPCFSTALNEVRVGPNSIRSATSTGHTMAENDDPSQPIVRHLHEHPAFPVLLANPEHGPVRLHEVANRTQLDRNGLYRSFYHPSGLKRQITFTCGRAQGGAAGTTYLLAFNRKEDREFTDAELQLVSHVRPHISRALVHLEQRWRLEALRESRDAVGVRHGCAAITLGPDGRWLDASSAIEGMLREWWGREAVARRMAPAAVVRFAHETPPPAKPLQQDGPDGARLEIHRAPGGAGSPHEGTVVLWLRELRSTTADTLAVRLGVTTRQAEVLRWLSAGKSNAEIGAILGLGKRTVDKHIENIFDRLGVESRLAATRLVLEAG